MMKRFYPLFVLLFLLWVSCSKSQLSPEEQIKSGVPVVTLEATEITMNSAVLHGYVKKESLSDDAEVGILVSKSQNLSAGNGTKLLAESIGSDGRFFVQASGLASTETYYYRAFMSSGEYREGSVREFTTEAFTITAIDMGLSVKWGSANLGANAPEEYGDYYAWGETTTKSDYSWNTYQWCQGSMEKLTKYNHVSEYGDVDNINTLMRSDDVAYTLMGGQWRMPTGSEVEQLAATKNNPKYQWKQKSINGKPGYEIVYLVNGNTLFLPLAGHRCDTSFGLVGETGLYWSSSVYSGSNSFGADELRLHMNIKYVERVAYARCYGLSVRPVLP